ncbi:Rz-like spanin [Variovorax phage VAC_51]|uniref:Rz-like spanin n=1 Tax=Variovorax phage VAC_51 TaxID=2985242 RepID=A0A9N6X049_9CAUD|nr:Rz-like spanin [Variovorax phage VAC_51]
MLPVAPTPALPPADLYEAPVNVPEPPQGALTNAGLSKYALSLIEALGLANADRAAIRAWASTIKKEK